MLSLQLAKKLKDAGLQWEPQKGDWFATSAERMANILVVSGKHDLAEELGGTRWTPMNGKRLTRREKVLLIKYGLNPANWLVEKRPPGELHLQHRHTGRKRVLQVGRRVG